MGRYLILDEPRAVIRVDDVSYIEKDKGGTYSIFLIGGAVIGLSTLDGQKVEAELQKRVR